MKMYIGWLARGLAMGAANVIPGVSGGTIAFITGIFERLINGLKSFDLEAIKLVFQGRFRDFYVKTDLLFLGCVLTGVGISILSLAKVLELAFQYYESLTLAFFFGLIIASILGVGRQIGAVSITAISFLIVGVLIAGGIAFLPPAEPNPGFLYVFICGAVAVSSMILPGLSGSYVLLLMGNYILVLKAISGLQFNILVPMALGCGVGLIIFSRFLSWLFSNYRSATISLLTGFVAGSLAIIWPWKQANYLTLPDGREKAIGYEWLLPQLNFELVGALVLALVGFFLVYWMDQAAKKKESATN